MYHIPCDKSPNRQLITRPSQEWNRRRKLIFANFLLFSINRGIAKWFNGPQSESKQEQEKEDLSVVVLEKQTIHLGR